MNLLPRYIFLLVFSFAVGILNAQLFSPPQSLMNDKGFDAHRPPKDCQSFQLRRYIPGARFPGDFDVMIEDFSFDRQGNLIKWRKYQTVMGERILELNYSYDPSGLILEERIWAQGNSNELIRNYNWEAESAEGTRNAIITNQGSKKIGNALRLKDGSLEIRELISDAEKFVITNYDKNGRLVSSKNEGTLLEENFKYDESGWLVEINAKSPVGISKVEYKSKMDSFGRVAQQTEIGKGQPRTVYFQYDSKGRIFTKGNSVSHIGEARNYDLFGRLEDVVYFDSEGFPKEILKIAYTSFEK